MEPINTRKIKSIYVKDLGWISDLSLDRKWDIHYNISRGNYRQNDCEYAKDAVIAIEYHPTS